MTQSFLHVWKNGFSKDGVIEILSSNFNLKKQPEIFDGRDMAVKELRSFLSGACKKPLDNIDIHVIIFHCDKMNAEAANTILKILEEPPRYLYFHLITNNPHSVLPTLNSRCRILYYQTQKDKRDPEVPETDDFIEAFQRVKAITQEEGFTKIIRQWIDRAIASDDWIGARKLERLIRISEKTNASINIAMERLIIERKMRS